MRKKINQNIQAVFLEDNAMEISPSELYEFLVVLILKSIKKRTL